jgi:hypothetical protein
MLSTQLNPILNPFLLLLVIAFPADQSENGDEDREDGGSGE